MGNAVRLVALCLASSACSLSAQAGDCAPGCLGFSPEAYRNPPPESSPAFFWMWNSALDVDLLCSQLDAMASNGLMNVCIHPVPKSFRPGRFQTEMSPDYMTPGYLDVYAKVVARARELGMHSWLYDEGGWPSGGAAGLVAASDGEGRFRPRGIGLGWEGEREFGVYAKEYAPGGGSYPSMIERGATGRFIELTHEKYRERLAGEFGKTVKFVFTDEPQYQLWYWWPMLPWCEDFAEEFRRRKGYDILPAMREVVEARYATSGEAVERRLDCMDVLGDLFVERYMLPLRDWCRRNNLKFGGHLGGEDDPENGALRGFGSLLKTLRAMDVPGVDVIWRQVWPDNRGGPGRQPPFPRLAASAARQTGAKNVLCEAFGIYGDSLSPLEMQWLCNYHMVRGVNTFVFGYQAVSTRGQWITLFEPHLGPVSPLWGFSGPFWRRLHRMCGILAQGRSAAETAVFYDQRSFWRGGAAAKAAAGLHYAAAASLDAMNCDFDFVDDDILASAVASNGVARCGEAAYTTVVVPSSGGLLESTRLALDRLGAAGVRVLSLDGISRVPRTCRVEGVLSEFIRASKRVSGGSAMYLLVNELMSPTDELEISLAETGQVVRVNQDTGLYERVESIGGRFRWKFDAAGAELFIVGETPEAEPRRAFAVKSEAVPLKEGWTMTPLRRHYVGKDDFVSEDIKASPEPAAPGDWGEALGHDFSGVVLYRNEFESEGGEAELNLGRVCWTCSAWLNGERLPDRFAGPFKWQVRLKKGVNTLEVKVANTLANAVADGKVRDRVAREFPPRGAYEARQAEFDRHNLESGLLGPVTLTMEGAGL